MHFDRNFKLNLTESLRRNKGFFYDITVKNYKPVYIDLFAFSYFNRSIALDAAEKSDIKPIWQNFQESLDNIDYPKLIKLYHFYKSTQEKEGENYEDITRSVGEKTSVFERTFWEDLSQKKAYEALSDFNCFKDLTIKEEEIEKYKLKRHLFNAEGWVEYYKSMFQLFLPEYLFNSQYSNNSTWRFLSKISDQYLLGFEFNALFFKSEIVRYRLLSPPCRFILINTDFDHSVTEEAYLPKNDHPQILVLDDNFNNPYFPGIIESIEILFAAKFLAIPFIDFVKENGAVQLRHNKSLGELFKTHAFFEFYIITFFIKLYLEYFSFSINNNGIQVSREMLTERLKDLEKRNQFLNGEIEKNETLIVQYKNQKVPKKLLQQFEMALSMLKNQYAENSKELLDLAERLNVDPSELLDLTNKGKPKK